MAEWSKDLIEPTAMIAVPRVFERVFGRIQNQLRDKKPIGRHLFHFAVDVGWQCRCGDARHAGLHCRQSGIGREDADHEGEARQGIESI
ncbi:MAG TPA: hypothetical protein EYO59_05515 [Chromatiaceae bacterium]|nr:hypothetical protein [Chromatiaceae bacterium]